MNHLIRAASLSCYVPLATTLGLDADRELQRFGLSEKGLEDPDILISYRSMIELLAHSAQAASCPDFGLRLSMMQGMSKLGPLAVAMEHAATLKDALSVAGRYLFVHTPAARLEVRPVSGQADQVDLCYAIDVQGQMACDQALEMALGVIHNCVRILGQGDVHLILVSLPHRRLGAPESYQRVFGAPCRFEQSHAAVRLNTSDLGRPLPHRNDLMRKLAQTYLESQYTAPEQAFSDRVRLLVRQFLASGEANHEQIARMLAVHSRTMQRRLSGEGTSFEHIKDEVRRSLFQQLITQPGGPAISTIASLLDYAEPSALTRSAKRWFGKTPTELRSAV